MRWGTLLIMLATASITADNDVSVRAFVDRTAAFVGDRVTYTVELTCKRGVDILADDLSRDKLKLEGLDVLGSDTSRDSGRDETTTYQFRYYLTTYRVDVPALTIAPLTVRYYVRRPGQRIEDTSPTGEVHVPATSIAFRSLLPDDQDVVAIRDDRPAVPRRLRFALLQPIGLGLVIVSIVPALLAAAAVVRRRRAHGEKSRRRLARTVRHDERGSLEAVRSIDVSTLEGRREVFTRLNTLVREHLRDVCGVAGLSLTPAEIAPAVSSHGAGVPIELVTSVLATCDRARYAPAHAAPSADACRQAIEQVEHVISNS